MQQDSVVAVVAAVAAEAVGIAPPPPIPTETVIDDEAAAVVSIEAVPVKSPKPLWLPLESDMPLTSTSRTGTARGKTESGQVSLAQ
jgi:hypothetical protein